MAEVSKTSTALNNRKKKIENTIRENWFSYLLFGPTIILITLIMWVPFIRGIWMSFHHWPTVGNPEWVGLDNFTSLLSWDLFYISIKATVVYMSATLVQLIVGVGAALLIANISRFKGILSGLYLLGYTMPPVTTGVIWLFILNPNFGPVFRYLTNWGILSEPIYWSTYADSALAVITFVSAWTFWPFVFIIVLATRESIPESHYESARVYGAGRLQTLLNVTLPQLKSAILVAASLRIVWNLAKVSQPLQLTGGGPGYSTSVLAILMYRQSWRVGALGISYALGIILFVISLGAIYLFIREFEQESARAK